MPYVDLIAALTATVAGLAAILRATRRAERLAYQRVPVRTDPVRRLRKRV